MECEKHNQATPDHRCHIMLGRMNLLRLPSIKEMQCD